MPPKPELGSAEALGKKIADDLLNRPRPSEDSDDEPYELPAHIREKYDKLQASRATLNQQHQGLVDFVNFYIDQIKIGDAAMAEDLTEKQRQQIVDDKGPERAKLCNAIGLQHLLNKSVGGVGTPMIWPKNPPNYASARVDWLQLQPELHTFWNADSSQTLVMECFDMKDGDASPMTLASIWHGKDQKSRGGFNFMLHGPTQKNLTFGDCMTFLVGKILYDGFDPNVKYPEAKSATPGLLSGLIMSHLRTSEVAIMLVGIGVYEHDDNCISEWHKLCKQLVGLTKSAMPGFKPFRLLFINPERSEAVNRIKAENPDIPVLQCPTGPEFIQSYPSGSVKTGTKDKKGKNKA